MAKFEWTPEKDEAVKTMVRQGDSYNDICAVLGIERQQLQNRLNKLRKEDPTIPYAGNKSREPDSETEGKGELNDLERTLSELVTELQGENDKLKGELKCLYDQCEEQMKTITNLRDELQVANNKVRELQSELANTLNAMSTTETQLDEERQAREAAEAQAANDEYIAIYRQMSEEIDRLTAENRRQNNIIMGIIEKFLLTPSPEAKNNGPQQ